MIGQDKLIEKLNTLTLDTLPHSILLLGDQGSGKHTFVTLIKDKFNLPLFDITNIISQQTIDEIYTKIEPQLYLIDIDKLSVKEENIILKFVEEPLKNSFIIIIGKNKNTILPTIVNRCQIWVMESYYTETLATFLNNNTEDNKWLLQVCKTPGQVLMMQSKFEDAKNMLDMSYKIIKHISTANFANTLTISNKIAFKNESDKWDYDLFIKVLKYALVQTVRAPGYNDVLAFTLWDRTMKLLQDSNIPHINKQQLFERYLLDCKCAIGV